MMHRARIELGILAALGIAIAALVVAVRAGGSETAPPPAEAQAAAVEVDRDAPSKGGPEVRIADFLYDPDPIRVRAGDPVAWTNLDAVPHTVTAADGSWGSPVLGQGDMTVLTFNEPGTYVYICTLHPPRSVAGAGAPSGTRLAGGGGHGMRATVIVE